MAARQCNRWQRDLGSQSDRRSSSELGRYSDRRWRSERGRQSDRGSGTALALAVIGATIALAFTLVAALGAHALHARLSVAADTAALAAADTASGRVPGDPCARAATAAALHHVTLANCESTHTTAVVTVTGTTLGITLTASARAGLDPGIHPL